MERAETHTDRMGDVGGTKVRPLSFGIDDGRRPQLLTVVSQPGIILNGNRTSFLVRSFTGQWELSCIARSSPLVASRRQRHIGRLWGNGQSPSVLMFRMCRGHIQCLGNIGSTTVRPLTFRIKTTERDVSFGPFLDDQS